MTMSEKSKQPANAPGNDEEEFGRLYKQAVATLKNDEATAIAETRKRARQCGPAAVAFLRHVLVTEDLATVPQRIRVANLLLETAGFLAFEAKDTGINFSAPGQSDGGREP
jgi:hypothetical protein